MGEVDVIEAFFEELLGGALRLRRVHADRSAHSHAELERQAAESVGCEQQVILLPQQRDVTGRVTGGSDDAEAGDGLSFLQDVTDRHARRLRRSTPLLCGSIPRLPEITSDSCAEAEISARGAH